MGIIITVVIIAIVVLIGLYFLLTYNGLITLRNRVDEAWSDITVQLKRRGDLIPNLVASVQSYATHESGVFQAVTAARAQTMSAATPAQAGQAENQFQQAVGHLFAVAENYPDLKANQNFLDLQNALVTTEDRIQSARRFYNGNVRDFNTKVQIFPNNLLARGAGFSTREFFEVDEPERLQEPPKVSFN